MTSLHSPLKPERGRERITSAIPQIKVISAKDMGIDEMSSGCVLYVK